MENLPVYISIVFILTTFLAVYLLYKASYYDKTVPIVLAAWLAVQAALGLSGFYTITTGQPPRFALLVLPPLVIIGLRFFTKAGRGFIDKLDIKTLTLLHIVRIPVELTLYWLCLQKVVPDIMTFEGRNFDILCGFTAPLIYYFGFVKNTLSKNLIIIWNILCLASLANIVSTAVLSIPLPFQQFAFNQPNIALLYFPFIWLPCCVVPIVLFAHLATLRKLFKA